jgi:membrane protease subunit (stomatin/prohibitin family)
MSVFVEVIEWAVHAPEEMLHRLPEEGSADFKMGAQLIVQENQVALFVRDGKYLDRLGPGRHVLSTLNLPIITRLLSLPYGFESPFRAAVIFINRKVFTDLRWGTRNPVAFRDRELGVVRLRGYGRFSLRVFDPILFVNTLVGSRGQFAVTELEEYFRDVIVARLNDLVGEQVQSLYDLPALYSELGAAAKVRIREDFRRYGLELVDFYVNSITPPDPVQRMIDERSGMQAVGNLDDFVRFEAARAVGGHGGGNGGSTAGAAVEAGVGAGIGLGIAPGLASSLAGPRAAIKPGLGPAEALPAAMAAAGACATCHGALPAAARFCPMCGSAVAAPRACQGCQAVLPERALYCATCGRAASAQSPEAAPDTPPEGASPSDSPGDAGRT